MSSSVRPFLLHDAMFPSLHTVVKQAEEGEEEIMLFAWSPAPFQRERKRRDRGSIKQTTGPTQVFLCVLKVASNFLVIQSEFGVEANGCLGRARQHSAGNDIGMIGWF